jgi:uncharacterized membrane protein YeaQ/YmgE (transglycosylase-associated protein family)
MSVNIAQIIVWLILGAIAGATVSLILNRRRTLLMNIVLGLVGAVVGGFLFRALGITVAPGLLAFTIGGATATFDDFLAAVVGALLVLGILYVLRRGRL